MRRWRLEDGEFVANLGKVIETVSKTKKIYKRVGGIAQVAEQLPTVGKALSSIPSTAKKKEGRREGGRERREGRKEGEKT
jgi:hypothetical protein